VKNYKILNLYACLGGNRYKWDEVAKAANINMSVTAVEWDEELAKLYKERFPNDKVIVADAHQYLLQNFRNFDFIWSSPPCPTHSRARFWNAVSDKTTTLPKFPDMKLYEEIVFLQNWFKGKYCVENVIPYYDLLIPGYKRDRHIYWANFNLPNTLSERTNEYTEIKDNISKLSNYHDYDFTKYTGEQKIYKIARNLVDYEAGRTILETALNIQRQSNTNQIKFNF